MNTNKKILIEGYKEHELLKLINDPEVQDLVFGDIPVVFTAGTSQVLGQF